MKFHFILHGKHNALQERLFKETADFYFEHCVVYRTA